MNRMFLVLSCVLALSLGTTGCSGTIGVGLDTGTELVNFLLLLAKEIFVMTLLIFIHFPEGIGILIFLFRCSVFARGVCDIRMMLRGIIRLVGRIGEILKKIGVRESAGYVKVIVITMNRMPTRGRRVFGE